MRKVLPLIFTLSALFMFIAALPSEADAQRPNRRARKLASDGDKLYNRNRYEEALQKYSQAVRISPRFPRAHFRKGNIHLRLNQTREAVSEFDIAQAQGYPAREVVAVRMEAHFANGDYDAAERDAKTAIRLSPNEASHHRFLGRVAVVKQDFAGAVEALERSLELGDKSHLTFYLLAVSHNVTGDHRAQGLYAQEALKSGTPEAGNAWYLVGDAESKGKLYQAASQSFTNSINAYKRDIEIGKANDRTEDNLYLAYTALADVYRNLNRFDDAIDTAKEGLSLRPNDGNLHISLAWYYSLAGNTANAVAAGQKAVQLSPGVYMAHTNLCRAYNDQGEYFYGVENIPRANTNFNQAIASCKRALALKPDDGETNYYLGRAYFFLDNSQLSDSYYRKSVPGLEQFTQANPDYSDGFYLLGNAYFATGQNRKAIAAYRECLRISPRFARVRYNLGYVLVQEGQKEEARNQQIILEELDKDLADKLGKVISGE